MSKWYTIYRGDEYICQGTRNECAAYLNIKPDTISFMTTPAYLKRRMNGENHLIVLVDNDDEDLLEDVRNNEMNKMIQNQINKINELRKQLYKSKSYYQRNDLQKQIKEEIKQLNLARGYVEGFR